LEAQRLRLLSRTELQAALTNGAFRVVSWTAAGALALLYLNTHSE